ncbi:MAG: hypothetical protein ACR2OJ_05070 [Hyphomicrobiales bacterium]
MAYVGTTNSHRIPTASLWSRIVAWSKVAFERSIRARELEARRRIIALHGEIPDFYKEEK